MKKATKEVDCGKCLGHGTIHGYSHVVGGQCFACGGTGKKTVAADYRPATKYGCVYAGNLLFWIRARSAEEALRRAKRHWQQHATSPAFAGITEEEICVVSE